MKRKSCFVIMPFRDDFNEVYHKHIKPLIEEQLESVECVRIDEKPKIGCSIISNIREQISKCTFAIADITGWKPNVFYEIGFAHALNKKVILIKNKKIRKLPFDICVDFVIGYDRDTGYGGLQTLLKKVIADNIKTVKVIEPEKKFYSDNICGEWSGEYQIKKQKYNVLLTTRKVQIGNTAMRYIADSCISIDNEYHIFQTLQYNGVLNQNSRSPEEWINGNWIEFIGTSWTNISGDIIDYPLNVYAINKKVEDNRLWVKIWDNMNTDKIDVYFNRR